MPTEQSPSKSAGQLLQAEHGPHAASSASMLLRLQLVPWNSYAPMSTVAPLSPAQASATKRGLPSRSRSTPSGTAVLSPASMQGEPAERRKSFGQSEHKSAASPAQLKDHQKSQHAGLTSHTADSHAGSLHPGWG